MTSTNIAYCKLLYVTTAAMCEGPIAIKKMRKQADELVPALTFVFSTSPLVQLMQLSHDLLRGQSST